MSRWPLRRIAAGALAGLLATYLLVVSALYAAQRSLIYPAPAAPASVPAGYERVTLRTADGLDLAAAWHPPALDRKVALFFHGNGDDWAGGARAMTALQAAGYGVLLPEYRGYGTNPGSPDEPGFHTDARAAMAWLGRQGYPPGRVVIVGNSIGSGPATRLAHDVTPAALILVSPLANLPDVVASRLPLIPAHMLVKDRFDNERAIASIKAPVLLLHGTADRLIGIAHSERLARALPRATLVRVAGAGHDLAWREEAGRIEARWLGKLP